MIVALSTVVTIVMVNESRHSLLYLVKDTDRAYRKHVAFTLVGIALVGSQWVSAWRPREAATPPASGSPTAEGVDPTPRDEGSDE